MLQIDIDMHNALLRERLEKAEKERKNRQVLRLIRALSDHHDSAEDIARD